MPLVLGVDSSTQACKVEVRDADTGALVAHGRAPHTSTTPPRSEQDPNDWWDALERARQGMAAVDAIGIAAQQHGMVALDAQYEVVRPAKLWNDTESAPDTQWLLQQLDPGEWARACGSVPVPSFTITKLSWLHRMEPESWARMAHVCLPHDYLTWKLSGALITDRGDASGTGYFDPHADAYRWDLLAIVDRDRDWSGCLPPVVEEPLQAVGSIDAALVAPGTGDNMGAALGIGLQPGDVAISLGTSGTVFAVHDTASHDASGAVAGFADATGRFLPLVCTLNATKVTDAIARLLGVDHDELDALALAAPAGSNGAVLVPYFDGERTPNRPDARGVLAGLHSDVSREQLARAAFEGVVCGLLEGLDALIGAGIDARRIVLIGGGAPSRAYQQLFADLSGRTVTVPRAGEYVAMGACRQAAAVLHGAWPEWDVDLECTVEPTDIDRDAIRARYAAVRG
ncbi:MAG TPA: xylulokinase [Acidimicrobiia bacterium]|nr:xylulokinase [Acidimicrobiia bacterium]